MTFELNLKGCVRRKGHFGRRGQGKQSHSLRTLPRKVGVRDKQPLGACLKCRLSGPPRTTGPESALEQPGGAGAHGFEVLRADDL